MENQVRLLVAVPQDDASRYFKALRKHQDFDVQMVTHADDVQSHLADQDNHTDVLVLSQAIPEADKMVHELHLSYPRLLIVLVDEEADFAIPGQADEISTDPFNDDDLAKRIQRLMADRQLETLRADSLPAVRQFAKRMREANGEIGKLKAAASACLDMNYDYVAFYRQDSADPVHMTRKAQDGPRAIQAVAPDEATGDDIMGWVTRSGESRIAGPEDSPNHPLVARGRLGAVACVPITISGERYGVIAACRDMPNSITQENVLMLELISAQLAAALSRESIL